MPKSKILTHVFAVLDRSGSMAPLTEDTIGGYNNFIDKLKDQNVKVTLSLFDDRFESPYQNVDVKKVPKLTGKKYYARGMTALIDAVCKTLNENKDKVKSGEKAIVLIITDGLENSSQEYSKEDLKKLISSLDKKKNWTFTYLGADQDAWAVSKRWGFKSGNVSTYRSTPKGTAMAFAAMSVNTVAMAEGTSLNTQNFYSAEDREKLRNAK